MYRTSCGDRRRPPPLGRDLRQAGAHRVLNHVVERVGVLLVALDQARAETAAEDVVGAAVDFVERTRVAAVQVAHSLRQVRLRRLDDEVVMVSHQAIGVDAPAITAHDPPQRVEEQAAVVVVEKDPPLVVPARRHVVHATGHELAERPRHTSTVPSSRPRLRQAAPFGTGLFDPRHVPGTGRG
jgi:hypothetical protein